MKTWVPHDYISSLKRCAFSHLHRNNWKKWNSVAGHLFWPPWSRKEAQMSVTYNYVSLLNYGYAMNTFIVGFFWNESCSLRALQNKSEQTKWIDRLADHMQRLHHREGGRKLVTLWRTPCCRTRAWEPTCLNVPNKLNGFMVCWSRMNTMHFLASLLWL